MAPRMNVCTQCDGVQIIGPDGVGRDLDSTPTPMLHHADQLFTGKAEDVELDSYHLDCLPARVENAHRAAHGKAIDAAKAGTRGEKLIALIGKGNGFDADDPKAMETFIATARKAG